MKITFLVLSLLLLNTADIRGNETMGAMDKIPEEQPKIVKTSTMLDENQFWSIVDKSLRNSNSQEEQEVILIEELQKLSPSEIIGFRLRTDKFLYDTYNSEMWCAAYIMNGGCSDDCFEYFRLWVISRGKETYLKAKENPDSLISTVADGHDYFEFETFWYVALTAFEKKTGKELYDFIDNEGHKFSEGAYPKFDFSWQEDKPETMQAICPQLFKMFWK